MGQALEKGSYLLLQLEINMDATEQLAALADEKDLKLILNPAPMQPLPDTLYQKLYLITPNEVEAGQLSGLPCRTTADCDAISNFFFQRGVSNVIITRGSDGVYLNDGSGGMVLENYPVTVKDTTGAGDAFNGGLLAGLSQGRSLQEAAAFGHVVSNLAVTRLGTAPAMPDQAEIAAFIAAHGLRLPHPITE